MTRHIYTQFLSLQMLGLIIGVVLIAAHVFALVQPARTKAFLKALPRNKQLGIAILARRSILSGLSG